MLKFLLLAVIVSLPACGHVPVSTMWALRSLDVATLDPSTLRAAIRTPEGLEPRAGGVTLTLIWGRDHSGRRDDKFVLRETTDAIDLAPLAAERSTGTRISAYRVDPDDYVRIRALQREANEQTAGDSGRSKLSFGVGADACRHGDLPDGAVLMTSYLRTQMRGPYLTLVKNIDLRALATKEKSIEALVPPCESK